MVQLTAVLASAILIGSAVAHPGHNVEQEAMERRSFIESKPRTVADCASKLKERGHTARGIQRRALLAQQLQAEWALPKRDLTTVLNTDHHSNKTGLTPDSDPDSLFADNSSCVLQPDVTEGPYYVSGELIRKDVRENQAGVTSYVYVQVVDVSTCEPLDNIYIDFWHCNATGVYGGIAANGNGNGASSNLNNTAFRGIQTTDSDGVAEFITIVPGHYTGRTNHIHLMTHEPSDITVYPNGTLGTNELLATHVGQLFFDQKLLTEVEQTSPYSTNTQSVTTNANDGILAQEAATSDPMVEYVYLGDSVSDGLLMWATIGIDTTNSIDVVNAAYYGTDGGHATGKGGGGPGGPPPNTTSSAA